MEKVKGICQNCNHYNSPYNIDEYKTHFTIINHKTNVDIELCEVCLKENFKHNEKKD